ncbi:MAG TPA: GNAT family N-acetyltransferase [Clostridia bacterium]|nr:GNAT family N-acetyltransferase [Clostridia bacterium]
MNHIGTVELVEAEVDDLRAMLALYNDHIAHTTALFDHEEIDVEEFKNRLYIHNDRYKTFCIYADNETAGFCFLSPFRKKIAYDKTVEIGLYLKPQFTGQGLGGEIVNYMEIVAKTNGFEMLVASVSGENLPSIKLFRKLNYEQCSHYKAIATKFGRKLDIFDFQKAILG